MAKQAKRPSRAGKRIGGKGCPSCGSHDTDFLRASGTQWCSACDHKWTPCGTPYCKGFEVDVSGEFPTIRGCRSCGVPDRIARWWPEAYRAVYKALGGKKLEELGLED